MHNTKNGIHAYMIRELKMNIQAIDMRRNEQRMAFFDVFVEDFNMAEAQREEEQPGQKTPGKRLLTHSPTLNHTLLHSLAHST